MRFSFLLLAPLALLACSDDDTGAPAEDGAAQDGASSSSGSAPAGSSSSSGSVPAGSSSSGSSGAPTSSSSSSGALPPDPDDAGASSSGGPPRPPATPADDVQLVPATSTARDCATSWCWDTPSPSGVTYEAALGFDDGTAIAGGYGDILTFDGTSWRHEPLPTTSVRNITFAGTSLQDVWLVPDTCQGDKAVFWHRTGTTWASVTTPLPCRKHWGYGAWVDEAGRLIVSGAGSTHRLDGNVWRTWTGVGINSFWSAGGVSYAGANDRLLRFDGDTWTDESAGILALPVINLAYPGIGETVGSGPNDVWVLASRHILHFDGTAWSVAAAPTSEIDIDESTSLAMRFPNEVYFATGSLFHAHSNTVEEVATPEYGYYGISAARGYLLARGVHGRLARFNTLGNVSDVQRTIPGWVHATSLQSATEAYVTYDRTLYARDATGWRTLGAMPDDYTYYASDVWGATADSVFVSLPSGDVAHYAAGAWSIDRAPFAADGQPQIFGSSANRVVSVASNLVRRWNGTVWSTDANIPDFGGDVTDVAVTPTEVIVASAAGLYVETTGTWALVAGTENHRYRVLAVRGADILAVGDEDATDGGVAARHAGTWTFDDAPDQNVWAASIAPDGGMFAVGGSGYEPESLRRYVPGVGWSKVMDLIGHDANALFVSDTQVSLLTPGGLVRHAR